MKQSISMLGVAYAVLCGFLANYAMAKKTNLLQANAYSADTAKHASADTAALKKAKTRTYEIGLEGANDQSHYGMRNTKPLPYIEPSFTYTAKSGFYAEASTQYLLAKQQSRFDVFALNPGWNISFSENTTLDFNYQYYHHQTHTPNYLLGGLTGVMETYIDQYIMGELEGRLTADYDIYKRYANQPKTPNDFIFTPDLLYTFEWDFGKKSSLSVMPEFNMDLGTRNMYTIARKTAQNDSINNLKTSSKSKYTVSNNSSFGTLDYNIILSLEYTVGKLSFIPALTYTCPLYSSTKLSSTKPSAFVQGSVTLTYDFKSKK